MSFKHLFLHIMYTKQANKRFVHFQKITAAGSCKRTFDHFVKVSNLSRNFYLNILLKNYFSSLILLQYLAIECLFDFSPCFSLNFEDFFLVKIYLNFYISVLFVIFFFYCYCSSRFVYLSFFSVVFSICVMDLVSIKLLQTSSYSNSNEKMSIVSFQISFGFFKHDVAVLIISSLRLIYQSVKLYAKKF